MRLENKLTVCKSNDDIFFSCQRLWSIILPKKILHGPNVKAGDVFVWVSGRLLPVRGVRLPGCERVPAQQRSRTLPGTAPPLSSKMVHRKKKVREFPVPSRDVTTKLSLGGNNYVITELFLPRGSLVSDIPAGDGKLVNLFLRCITHRGL